MSNLFSIFQKYHAIVFFDTETTGLYAKRDKIIELAAIRVEYQKNNSLIITKKIKYLKSSSLQQKQIQQISNIYVFESGYQNAEKALKRLLDYSQGDVLKCTVGMGEEVKIPNKYGANKYGEFLYGKKDSEFISLGDYVETADEFGTSFTGIVQKEKYSLTTGIIVKELEIKEVKDYGSWQLD